MFVQFNNGSVRVNENFLWWLMFRSAGEEKKIPQVFTTRRNLCTVSMDFQHIQQQQLIHCLIKQ
ncbi:hypothetical protein T4C_11551 [Trichinella pseudospiralis]|uniref:Uncharacterized protein n=1 Tax=Trichinella pseudospiralis TaxID=6337 RepID=A0A0V1J0V8_TRIPS|nr:hypothetical protein T4C_11551 [Trichinella pseudospiralis]